MDSAKVAARILTWIFNNTIENQIAEIPAEKEVLDKLSVNPFFVWGDSGGLSGATTHKLIEKEVCAAILCERTDFLYWRLLKSPSFLFRFTLFYLYLFFYLIPLSFLVIGLACIAVGIEKSVKFFEFIETIAKKKE